MERPAEYTTLISGNKAALSHSHVTKTWELDRNRVFMPYACISITASFLMSGIVQSGQNSDSDRYLLLFR